jgi:hypothetical protein
MKDPQVDMGKFLHEGGRVECEMGRGRQGEGGGGGEEGDKGGNLLLS